MQVCDLLVRADWLLPIAPQNVALRDQAIAIHQGQIIATGPWQSIVDNYQPMIERHFEHHVLMPGLVNAHGHAAMTLLRGAGEDQPLQAWLSETIWPLEAKVMGEEYIRLGTEYAVAEMLSSGTTTFADMYFFPKTVAQVCDRNGIRCQIAPPIIDFANAWTADAGQAIDKCSELLDQYADHSRINVAFGPHSAYTVSRENLVAVLERAAGRAIHIHMHENAEEVSEAQSRINATWLDLARDIGLAGPNVQMVHMTQLSEADMDWLAETQTRVVHCPKSNAKLASGYCHWSQLRARGVQVGIGTDGAASNNRLDLFEEAHTAALLAKLMEGNATAARAPDMVEMMTLGGARVLGLDADIGSIEVGKQADFIAVDLHTLGLLPTHDPFAAVLHGAASRAVTDVYVGGDCLLADQSLSRIDTDSLNEEILRWHAQAL